METKSCAPSPTEGERVSLTSARSPRWTPSPTASSTPPGSRDLARKLEELRGSPSKERKLRELKARILQQRLGYLLHAQRDGGEPPHAHPLKRKVCKVGFASSSVGSHPGQGRTTVKKQRPSSAPCLRLEKAQKERAARLFGASAWRQGQELARKILGPRCKYPLWEDGAERTADRIDTELEQDLVSKCHLEDRSEEWRAPRNPENCHAMQRPVAGPGQESGVVKLNRMAQERNSLEKVRLEKCQGTWTRSRQVPARNKENAGPLGYRGKPKPSQASEVRVTSSLEGLLEDRGRHSAKVGGRTSRPLPRAATPPKERQPSQMPRRNPYSPEEVREFMTKKVAERRRKSWEEQRSLKQAHEARNRRLQEVYRKQKEAFSRKQVGTGAQPGRGRHLCTGAAKENRGQRRVNGTPRDSEVTDRIRRASFALLRTEMKQRRDVSPHTDAPAEMTRMYNPALSDSFRDDGLCPLTLTDLDLPAPRATEDSESTASSLERPVVGREMPAPSDAWGVSPYQKKRDRVRAVRLLARDLSERLEKEMGQLQGRSCSTEWRYPERSQETWSITKPEPLRTEWAALGSRDNPGVSHCTPRSPSPDAPDARTGLQEGASGAMQDAKEKIWSLLSRTRTGRTELQQAPVPEEKKTKGHTDYRNELQNGCPEGDRIQKENGLISEKPGVSPFPSLPRSLPPRKPLRLSRSSEPEFCVTLQQNPGREWQPGCLEAKVESSFPQGQGATLSSAHPPPGRAATTDDSSSERWDSHSQWSELSQFYGSSSTFYHFGLTMAEQYLREEELRARHQSALLKLREKALQEKTRAELALLELEERCQENFQGSAQLDATEKQAMLLTRLKQEQAEIRHLRNVCKAAHRERKLLLKQQKDLLEARRSTEHLWQQVLRRTEQASPQGVVEPFHFEEGLGLGRQEKSVSHPVTPCSEARSHPGLAEGLHSGSEERLLQDKLQSTKLPEEKHWLGCQEAALRQRSMVNLPPAREPSISPTLKDGDVGAADQVVNMAEDQENAGLIGYSQEENCLFSRKHFTTPIHSMQWKTDPEFQKAQAVLVNISRSSSASDLGSSQDTDITLPEEFVFLEEEPTGTDSAAISEMPAVVPVAGGKGSTLSSDQACHPSAPPNHGTFLVSRSKKEIPDSMLSGGRLSGSDAFTLSTQGSLRPRHPVVPAHAPATATRNAISSGASGEGAEIEGINPKAVEGAAEPENAPPAGPDAQGAACATGAAEGYSDGESTPRVGSQPGPPPYTPGASLENVGSVSELTQGATPRGSWNSTKCPSTSEGTQHCAECAGDEKAPQRANEDTVRPAKASTGNGKAGVPSERPEKGNQINPSTDAQKAPESVLGGLQPCSPKAGSFFQVQSGLPRSQEEPGFLGKELLPEMEDDTLTPVDEILLLGMTDDVLSPVEEILLSHGSTTLLSSTEKEASFQSEELPAPPEGLNGEGEDSSFSFRDFPSPPEQLMFPETEDLDEDDAVETNSWPSFSAGHCPEVRLLSSVPKPDASSSQLTGRLSNN